MFWQSRQSLGKSLFMEIIKTKRSRQEACFFPGNRVEQNNVSFKIWKYLQQWWDRWNTFLPRPLIPCPPAPENFYLLLTRILYYKYSRNLGGRVKSEEEKKDYNCTSACDSKQKGIEQSQKYSKQSWPSWVLSSPRGTHKVSQLSALNCWIISTSDVYLPAGEK